MTRPKKIRNIYSEPNITYFKPHGVPLSQLREVILTIDELEAIRLKNYNGLDQIECAKIMEISQSTFQRALISANKKIAEALIDGKAIRIEGGSVKIMETRMRKFKCNNCEYEWEEPFGTGKRGIDMNCPKCESKSIHRIDFNGHGFGKQMWGYKESEDD